MSTKCEKADKVIHHSEKAAKRAILAMKMQRRDGGGLLMPYRCGSHWHIGHGHRTRQTPRIRRRRR